MEKSKRIENYQKRIDKDYTPYYEFLKDNIKLLDSNFEMIDTKFDEMREDKPYVSHQVITNYGTEDFGIEVCLWEEYDSKTNNKIKDGIMVSAYGLSQGKTFTIESIRCENEPNYVEIKITGKEEIVDSIIQNFIFSFQEQVQSLEQLKNELVVIRTAIKRRAWNIVEIRAKNSLKIHPQNLELKLYLAIAQAAQGDLSYSNIVINILSPSKVENSPSIQENQQLKPIQKESEKIIELITEVRNLEPKNQSIGWLIGQIYESLGLIENALKTYQSVAEVDFTPEHPTRKLDLKLEIKNAINRLQEINQ